MNRVAFGSTLLWVAVATAVPPKYTKKEASVTSQQTALTKPAQRAKEEKQRPTIDASDVFGGVGEQLKAVTDQQIKVMQRLIENTGDDDPEKPDYHFRIAELYAQQEHYYSFRARELDQKIFEAVQANKAAVAEQFKKQQTDYENREKTWLKAAVKEYLKVTENPKFNGYKRMDEVLFYLAFLLTQQKREDLARPIFKRLIKDYPDSKYIPDALLSFGEYYFEQKDIENALRFYDKVLQYPQSRVFGYALYKKGWCYLNLQDFKSALQIFERVILETKVDKKDTNKLSLLKEAKKDSVRAYSQISSAPPDKAWPYFQRIGGDFAPTMLEQLGELYNAQGKFPESIVIYRQLIKLNPTSPKLCSWQEEILRNTLSKTGSRATPEAVQELERLSAVLEKFKTMAGVKREAVEECRDNTAGSLRELATTWHKEAQKTNVKETYALAQSLYKEYITKFPEEKDVYPMTFYYGELLFKLEKFCDSAPVYTNVVTMNGGNDARYRNESAYAAVISWKNCLAVDDQEHVDESQRKGVVKDVRDQKKGKGKEKDPEKSRAEELAKFKPLEIPEKWHKMLDAFDTYIKYVPNSPELPTIRYRKARVFYEYNHFEDAAKFFREVVENHRDSELAPVAANLLFDCDNILRQAQSGTFEQLRGDTKKYCSWPDLIKDGDFVKQCDTITANLTRMEIEDFEHKGEKDIKYYRKAADMYCKLAEEHPEDPKVDEVWYNCAIDYERAKQLGKAIETRIKLIKLKPVSILAQKSVFFLGRAYRDIAAYDKAAEQFETFAVKYPGEKAKPGDRSAPDAATALYSASIYRRGLGEVEKAVEDAKKFVDLYGNRGKENEDKAAGVFFGLAQIYEQQKDRVKLAKHLNDYLKAWGQKGGADRQIIANVKLGELAWADSCPVAGVNGACIEVTRVRASSATRVAERASKGKKGKKLKKKGAVLPAQCGPETKSKITLHERKPALIKQAQDYFAAAMKEYANGAAVKKIPGKDEAERAARADSMMYYVAEARSMEGNREYEKLIGMKIPDKLDFTPVDVSASKAKQAKDKKRLDDNSKKFKTWYETKIKQVDTAQKIYQQVILFKQAHWAIAAAARIGQIFQDFSGQLYTAPVPKAGKAPEGMSQEEFDQLFHDSYCDQMTDTAEPLETKAVEGLSTCLKKSTDLQWFNEWSALCEAELNQIKPQEYPLASEIRGVPGYFDKRPDSASLITELKQ